MCPILLGSLQADLSTDLLHVALLSACLIYADSQSVYEIGLARIQPRLSTTLLGQDRIYIWSDRETYQELLVPVDYLAYCKFGVHHASVSPGGSHIALSGHRGFALFSKVTQKWKISQDLQTLQCTALTWCGEFIIAIGTSDKVLLFTRTGIDIVTPLVELWFPSAVSFVDIDLFPGLMLVSQMSGSQTLYSIQPMLRNRCYPIDECEHVPLADLSTITVHCQMIAEMVIPASTVDVCLVWSYTNSFGNYPKERFETTPSNSWIWPFARTQEFDSNMIPGLDAGVIFLDRNNVLWTVNFGDQTTSDTVQLSPILVCDRVQRFWISPMFGSLDAPPEFYLWTYSVPDGAQARVHLKFLIVIIS
uniref:Uncharacterized protein n=1 Tax=Spongospora subterranea TaxID=70186 RepID=A0A0H5R1P6_9EUKA|eukprot:CRZ01729.1 hypothetical protein [Spongospora subterranea]